MRWTKAPFPAPSGAPTIRQVVASTDILPDLLRRTLVAVHQVTDGREVGTGHLSAETSGILLGQADPPIRSRRALVAGEHSMSHPHMHKRRRDVKPARRFRGRDQAIPSHRDGSWFDRAGGGNRVLLAQAGHSPRRPGFAGRCAHLLGIEQLGNLMVWQTTGEFTQALYQGSFGETMPAHRRADDLMAGGHVAAPQDG